MEPDAADLSALYRSRFDDDDLADKRVLWSVLVRDWFQRYVPERGVVVDLGAGSCEFVNVVRARRRIAVDLNPDTAEHAAPGVEVLTLRSDAMTDLADGSVDTVFTSNLFEHLPTKDVLLATLAISMVLYVLACLVLTGMVEYTSLDTESAFAQAFEDVGLPGLATLISVGAIVGIVTVMFTFMFAVTRVWYAMARDGLLPRWFAAVDRKHHVPVRVTWIVGIGSALIAGFTPIGEAAQLTNIGILLAFAVVCSAVIVLRYRSPEIERGFRTPGMPVIPLIGVGASIWLTTYLTSTTWWRFGAWFLLGALVYALYGYRHSRLHPARRT